MALRSVALLALSASWAAGHPQCYVNDSPVNSNKMTSTFCPMEQFGGEDFIQEGSCCTDSEEDVIEAKFLLEAGALTTDCADLYKQVLCGQCHSFSGHMFARLGTEFGPWDGMAMKRDFCEAFVDACADQMTLGGPLDYDGLDYCEQHVGGGVDEDDEFWSFPYTDPEPVDGNFISLFPEIDAASQFPAWQTTVRQSPDGSMWWVVGIGGEISGVFTDEALTADTAFDVLDISNFEDFYNYDPVSQSEEGLLDIAFDPGWAANQFFYVSYTVHLGSEDNDGTPLGQNRIARFTYIAGDPAATLSTGLVILTTGVKKNRIHSAGWMGFKPSDYEQPNQWNDLYWSSGDGGPATDPNNMSQDLTNLLGGIIRISVPSFESAADLYEIPPGNYADVDGSAAPELCATGLRNPWRCSFDRLTDELYCADVGQDRIEEINIIECGKNYGWPRFEGSSCQEALENTEFYGPCATADRSGFEFPIYEICHEDYDTDDPEYTNEYTDGVDICGAKELPAKAIIGGYVYRGSYFSDLLDGAYIFSDHQERQINFIKKNDEGMWVPGQILSRPKDIFISFSEDINGELYLIDRVRDIFLLPCADLCSSTCLDQSEQQPSIEHLGCFADSDNNRALTLATASSCSAGKDYMTPPVCASYCSTIDGAAYSGVADGTDCYCGGTNEAYSKNGALDEESCADLCVSDPEYTCGGVGAIEVFELGPQVNPPTPSPLGTAPPVSGSTPAPFMAEETCVNGIPGIDGSNDVGDVCCPLDCGQCGDDGCGAGGRSMECCINGVLNNQPSCSVSGTAPCIVTDIIDPTPTPAPTLQPVPIEELCVNGIPGIDGSNDVGDVCCPLDCGQCGDDGCGADGRSKECCINGVLNNQPSCSVSGTAPCIVTDVVDPAPTPAPTLQPVPIEELCVNGIPGIDGSNDVGDVCCPLDCGQCGDDGCGADGRNKECCINGVLNNQPSCSVSGTAPCIVTDVIDSAPTPAPTLQPVPIEVAAYRYLGCFQDDRDIRILPTTQGISLTEMSTEFCGSLCDGFDFFGTQFSRECWCGSGTPEDTYNLYGQLTDAECDMECTGNTSESCGGRLIASVYAFNL